MARISQGAWADKPKRSIITKTAGGGRTFQRQNRSGTWKTYASPSKRKGK